MVHTQPGGAGDRRHRRPLTVLRVSVRHRSTFCPRPRADALRLSPSPRGCLFCPWNAFSPYAAPTLPRLRCPPAAGGPPGRAVTAHRRHLEAAQGRGRASQSPSPGLSPPARRRAARFKPCGPRGTPGGAPGGAPGVARPARGPAQAAL